MEFLRILAGIPLCIALFGCAPTAEATWTEAVALSDGRTIQVQRFTTWTSTHPMGESVTWLVNDIALRSDPKAPQPGLPEWTGNADEMLLFDFDNRDNTFVLVTHPTTCQRYNAGGRPDPPYFEYRVRNGKWQQVRFSESLVGREANMHVWPDPTGQPAFVDLSAKQKLQNKLRPQQRRLVASGRYGDC